MRAGDTFQFVGTADKHLWMVISDPGIDPDRVLIVNFTSWDRLIDQACIVEANEHPFVAHKTYVNYPRAKVVSNTQLEFLLKGNRLAKHQPLSEALLDRIRESVMDSRMPTEAAQILIDQRLIDE